MIQQLEFEAALLAREAGQAVADANADLLHKEAVDTAIRRLAARGEPFCADQVREIAGTPPPGFSPNVVGARFGAAAKAKIIRAVGFTTSRRVIGHGNRIMLWQGTGR